MSQISKFVKDTIIPVAIGATVLGSVLYLQDKPKQQNVQYNVEMFSYTDYNPTAVDIDKVNLEEKYNLPRGLLKAIHLQETSGRCHVDSKVGAQGCFQFMPVTQEFIESKFGYTFNPYNYEQSEEAAAIYLNFIKTRVETNYPDLKQSVQWGITIASYNAGMTNGLRWASEVKANKVKTITDVAQHINFNESRNYVLNVSKNVFGTEIEVKSGDTLTRISKEYDLDLRQLLSVVDENIKVGQIIHIKG